MLDKMIKQYVDNEVKINVKSYEGQQKDKLLEAAIKTGNTAIVKFVLLQLNYDGTEKYLFFIGETTKPITTLLETKFDSVEVEQNKLKINHA